MDKQIEEMARIIAFDLCPNRHVHAKWGEEAQCYSDNNFAECTQIKNVVDKLYEAGYRKIPEKAVVLTREEWAKRNAEIEIIKIDNDTYLKEVKRVCELELRARRELEKLKRDFDYNLVQERKQIRKETAEKFAERVKMAFYQEFDELIPSIMADKIDEIAKEITEGK